MLQNLPLLNTLHSYPGPTCTAIAVPTTNVQKLRHRLHSIARHERESNAPSQALNHLIESNAASLLLSVAVALRAEQPVTVRLDLAVAESPQRQPLTVRLDLAVAESPQRVRQSRSEDVSRIVLDLPRRARTVGVRVPHAGHSSAAASANDS